MKKRIAAFATFSFWLVTCFAQTDEPAVLKPIEAESAGPRYASVSPAADGEGHFIARARHLLDLVRRNPAPDDDPWFKINGVQFWPASPISRSGLKLLDEEGGKFDPEQRDRALKCGVPKELPTDTQVVLLEAQGSPLALPVFLASEGQELHYLELSLDQSGAPVLLVITGYNSLAVRITTSPDTRLAAVHLHTYYPNVVLGVKPEKVTQQYYGRSGSSDCRYGFSDAVQSPAVIQQLRRDPTRVTRYKTDGKERVVIGKPQAVKREAPWLGNYLDPDMPLPNNYGIVVLASLGYIRPVSIKAAADERIRGSDAFEVVRAFRIPEGLAGAHSVTFLLTPDSPIPSGSLAHSSLVRRIER